MKHWDIALHMYFYKRAHKNFVSSQYFSFSQRLAGLTCVTWELFYHGQGINARLFFDFFWIFRYRGRYRGENIDFFAKVCYNIDDTCRYSGGGWKNGNIIYYCIFYVAPFRGVNVCFCHCSVFRLCFSGRKWWKLYGFLIHWRQNAAFFLF